MRKLGASGKKARLQRPVRLCRRRTASHGKSALQNRQHRGSPPITTTTAVPAPHLLHLGHGPRAVDELAHLLVGQLVGGDERQQRDSLARARGHLGRGGGRGGKTVIGSAGEATGCRSARRAKWSWVSAGGVGGVQHGGFAVCRKLVCCRHHCVLHVVRSPTMAWWHMWCRPRTAHATPGPTSKRQCPRASRARFSSSM